MDLVAVNTALHIDLLAQVGLDSPASGLVSGVGSHADYAAAASRSAHGVSVVALPSVRHGQPTLVDRLAIPVSTPPRVRKPVAMDPRVRRSLKASQCCPSRKPAVFRNIKEIRAISRVRDAR
jgi:hypothetical protein